MTSRYQPQSTLPGLEIPIAPISQLTDRRSLAGLLIPERMGVSYEDYQALVSDTELFDAVDPRALYADLVGVPRSHPYGFTYRAEDDRSVPNIVVNPDEYKALPRSTSALLANSQATTLSKRVPIERDRGKAEAAARRSIGHTATSAYVRAEARQTMLKDEQEVLERFQKASISQNRGRAWKRDLDLRTELTTLQGVVHDMLGAVALHPRREQEQTSYAVDTLARAIDVRMVFPREHNAHLDYFAMLTRMLIGYNIRKQALFGSRMAELAGYRTSDQPVGVPDRSV